MNDILLFKPNYVEPFSHLSLSSMLAEGWLLMCIEELRPACFWSAREKQAGYSLTFKIICDI